jgi:acetylornithine deacetylase/succinyl-diaminopimelate desuccinylase-like protein
MGWIIGLLISSLAAPQQSPPELRAVAQAPAVQAALEFVDDHAAAAAELLRDLGAIISPSGHEHERAAAVAARMRAIGLRNVRVDEGPNAVGMIPGRSGRAVVLISTLDDLASVAEHQRAAGSPPVITADRVAGPGTNTSLTTAALLTAAEALVQAGIQPEHDLVFAAVAQEETGLKGMKLIYEEFRDRAEGFVDVLGDGHRISYGAIGIYWWRVVARGPAGHTLRGGLPNVNQAIGRAVDRILSLPNATREDSTRTRINVAMLKSGIVFNHKPDSAWFSLDIRSLDASIIEEIHRDVRVTLAEVSEETAIDLKMLPFQLTPGGQIPGARESHLVRTAVATARYLGYEPSLSNAGSSNMNVAIGGGTAAIGLGGGRGGARGSPEEWADRSALMSTARYVTLLAAALGGRQIQKA